MRLTQQHHQRHHAHIDLAHQSPLFVRAILDDQIGGGNFPVHHMKMDGILLFIDHVDRVLFVRHNLVLKETAVLAMTIDEHGMRPF